MTDDAQSLLTRTAQVRRVMIVVLVLNLLVAAAKAAYAAWSGSLAVATDSVHSVLDAAANVIGLIALHMASQPPDDEHPYGHGKFEIIAAAAIGVTIALGVFEFGKSAILALTEGREGLPTPVAGFAVVGGTWVVNMFVATYEARAARRLKSEFLLADAGHTASDVVVTAGVLGALVAARFGVQWADPVGALFVLVIVARLAWQILARNVAVLVDRVAIDPERVFEVAMANPAVRTCHRVRSHGTSFAAIVDLHIHLDGHLSLAEAHEVSHQVEDAIRAAIPHVADVTIHMEPVGDAEEGL